MNRSMKAALLSALVYPGIGHFYLKQYTWCAIFVSAFSLPLYFMLSELVSKMEQIATQISTGEIPLDVVVISEKITSLTTANNAQELNMKMYALTVVWLIAIFDSYRLGRTKNPNN